MRGRGQSRYLGNLFYESMEVEGAQEGDIRPLSRDQEGHGGEDAQALVRGIGP